MIKQNEFDMTHDTQKAFRKILSAFSFPMEKQDILKESEKIGDEEGCILIPALVLCDKETYVSCPGDLKLLEKIKELTYAREDKENPQFIFISLKSLDRNPQSVFSVAFPGTLENPHTSSTVILEVEKTEGDFPMVFEGPGIKGKKKVSVSQDVRDFVLQKEKQAFEYPMGVELIFVGRDGSLLALPRKVKGSEI